MQENIKQIIEEIIKKDQNVIALYNYGSHVYQTAHEKSDLDFIMVVDNLDETTAADKIMQYADVNVYSKEQFQTLINEHEISVLECLFLDDKHKWKENASWQFSLSLPQLRKACSGKSSNSWVKAKKKLIVEEDYNLYVGQKSAWHAIRILEFGRQIATTGKIEDFTKVNYLLPEILNCLDWNSLDNKFRKIYNSAGTDFKLVAPKELLETKPKIKM